MSALDDVVIDRRIVSGLLLELGVDLTHDLAAALVMGATDVLLALEVAQTLPEQADYEGVLNQLHSLRMPRDHGGAARVAAVQRLVLQRALADQSCAGIDARRVQAVSQRIEAGAPHAGEASAA